VIDFPLAQAATVVRSRTDPAVTLPARLATSVSVAQFSVNQATSHVSAFLPKKTLIDHRFMIPKLLDRVMAHYGREANEARDLLRRYTALKIELTWPKERTRKPVMDDPAALELLETLQDKLRALAPESEAQHWLKSRALQVSGDLAQVRWKLAIHNISVIPHPFLMVVVFWLAILFVSFGLFAPCNPMVITALFVSALSVAAGIGLILELERPLEGVIRVSAEPMQSALAHLRAHLSGN